MQIFALIRGHESHCTRVQSTDGIKDVFGHSTYRFKDYKSLLSFIIGTSLRGSFQHIIDKIK
jgi:hypothetical protein